MSGPTTDAAHDGAVPPAGTDVRTLSDAELIGRFQLVRALERALRAPCAGAGVHAAMACATRHNNAEMLDLVDDLVRRVVQRGPAALR